MNLLITGGLGYVGGRLATFFSGFDEYHVAVTTRKKSGETDSYHLPSEIHVINEFSASGLQVENATRNIDAIIHLASLNEIASVERPFEAMQVNVADSFRILDAAIKSKVKKFIYFSTAHVYGAPLKGTITEKTIPRPVHPYALTHRAFEDFVTAAMDNKKIDSVVLRLSNSFGPPSFLSADRWTLLVNDLCRQAVCESKLVLKSAGLQQRDFITLNDVCKAVKHCLEADNNMLADGVFNLGGNNSMTIIDMAKLIKERICFLLGKKIEISAPQPSSVELETDYSLEFKIDKLISTGFSLTNNVAEEIDNTILFCEKYFKK